MKYIRKIWVRILLSGLAGGMLAEIFHIKTGNNSPEISSTIVFIGSLVTFSFLAIIVWIDKYWYYFFPEKAKKGSDILDDLDLDE